MSNVVKFSINGDTNAEQVTGRAKAAISGFDKQLQGISNAFGNSFKTIFLSFLGPMALLGAAMAFVGKMIADNQRKQEEANQAAIDGTNKLMSAEDKYWANKRNNEKKDKQTVEEAREQRKTTTRDFLENDPRGQKIFDQALVEKTFGHPFRKFTPGGIANDPAIQEKVQAIIAEDMKNNPAAAAALKDSTFSGPQGFGNIIGVGSNAVIENLTRQTDIQQQILEFIRTPAARTGITDVDFTKQPIDTRNLS